MKVLSHRRSAPLFLIGSLASFELSAFAAPPGVPDPPAPTSPRAAPQLFEVNRLLPTPSALSKGVTGTLLLDTPFGKVGKFSYDLTGRGQTISTATEDAAGSAPTYATNANFRVFPVDKGLEITFQDPVEGALKILQIGLGHQVSLLKMPLSHQ